MDKSFRDLNNFYLMTFREIKILLKDTGYIYT